MRRGYFCQLTSGNDGCFSGFLTAFGWEWTASWALRVALKSFSGVLWWQRARWRARWRQQQQEGPSECRWRQLEKLPLLSRLGQWSVALWQTSFSITQTQLLPPRVSNCILLDTKRCGLTQLCAVCCAGNVAAGLTSWWFMAHQQVQHAVEEAPAVHSSALTGSQMINCKTWYLLPFSPRVYLCVHL